MKKVLLLAVLMVPLWAQGQLQWRVSIKVFTNSNGTLPRLPYWDLGGTNLVQELANGVNYANDVMATTGRGYRWRLTEIVTLAGRTDPLPEATNSWFRLPVIPGNQDDLDAKATANPDAFKYRDDAINIYYVDATNGTAGGVCTYPSDGQQIILVAPNSPADTLIHEVGHFFGLRHTHEYQQFLNEDNTPCMNGCSCARKIGGDDGFPDTAPDHQCWTNRNAVALGAYGLLYRDLNSDQQWRVDNAWLNVMSYHSPGTRFTDDQMDFLTDVSNTSRFNVATGRTRFVDWTHAGAQDGSRANPFQTIVQGVDGATPGDIVLIRPGNYNEPRSYTKAVTLRATRGTVTIGQ